jgi:Skp family chaperone for outer membrane proteins
MKKNHFIFLIAVIFLFVLVFAWQQFALNRNQSAYDEAQNKIFELNTTVTQLQQQIQDQETAWQLRLTQAQTNHKMQADILQKDREQSQSIANQRQQQIEQQQLALEKTQQELHTLQQHGSRVKVNWQRKKA